MIEKKYLSIIGGFILATLLLVLAFLGIKYKLKNHKEENKHCSKLTQQQTNNINSEQHQLAQQRNMEIKIILAPYVEYLQNIVEINAQLKLHNIYKSHDGDLKKHFNEFVKEKNLESEEILKKQLQNHQNPMKNYDKSQTDLNVNKRLEEYKHEIKVLQKTLEYNTELLTFYQNKVRSDDDIPQKIKIINIALNTAIKINQEAMKNADLAIR